NILKSANVNALEPEKIAALITLIDEDLGYQLHQAVQRLKIELSHNETAQFRFRDGSMNIQSVVTREEFESWIIDELESIEHSVDGLLASTNIPTDKIDRVFLTGGTSFVPAVRRTFESRFTAARVRTGNEFTSVARGLALRAREPSHT
ncbi:MAG TPA: Hsp70 family protein, partial [Edaphobacter sp.]